MNWEAVDARPRLLNSLRHQVGQSRCVETAGDTHIIVLRAPAGSRGSVASFGQRRNQSVIELVSKTRSTSTSSDKQEWMRPTTWPDSL